MISCIFLLVPTAFGQEVVALEQLGAVAAKCGEIAITEEMAHFPVIVQLSVLAPKMRYNNCTWKAIVEIEEQVSKDNGSRSWMSPDQSTEDGPLYFGDTDDWAIREEKHALLASFLYSYKCTYSFPK